MSKVSQNAFCVDGSKTLQVTDTLTVESPLQIRINEKPFTVTMRTPGEDHYLAQGLLVSEGIATPEGICSIQSRLSDTQDSDVLDIHIPEMYLCREFLDQRTLLSTSSCGICGKRHLDDLRCEPIPLRPSETFPIERLPRLIQEMNDQQTIHANSGGCHAAAACTLQGELLKVSEDIGRHNAVDKVIGFLFEQMPRPQAEVLLVSGRLSYEIVAKAYRAAIPILAAVSAVSSLAVETAQQRGMTVLGFCRGGRATVYSHPAQIRTLTGCYTGY